MRRFTVLARSPLVEVVVEPLVRVASCTSSRGCSDAEVEDLTVDPKPLRLDPKPLRLDRIRNPLKELERSLHEFERRLGRSESNDGNLE